jgi:hypothetical protein
MGAHGRKLILLVLGAGPLAVGCRYDLDQIRGRTVGGPKDAVSDGTGADGGGDAGRDALVVPDRPNAGVDAISTSAVGYGALVAYWPLDEGAGTFAWDVTGNGNDGHFEFEPMWRSVGFPAAAFRNPAELQFDGIDDFVEFTARNIPDLDQPKSVSLWARYDYDVDAARSEALMVLLNRKTPGGVRIEFRAGRLAVTTYFYN